ncbi:MAG TPA: hypothetical protein PKA13_02225 [Geminicoccaceae bacterium]|nr:hypothetical protein [Geminicoccus sp.]HMU48561.1 hypothetical protein [Geminicoccaceae bacterium]
MRQAIRTLAALWFLVVGALSFGAGEASAAAVIKSQSPCTNGGDTCFNFGSGIVGLGNFSIRTFSFTAPSKGSASVTFHGSLLCGVPAGTNAKVVDLVTQITNSASTAQQQGPGGMRQAAVILSNTSQTFNLASTRVFTFNAKGTQTFQFRVRPLRIDSGVNCYIYNAAFSVIFIP